MKIRRYEDMRRKRGFNLIEAVVASGILVAVAGASVTLSRSVLKGNAQLADRTAASYLAVEALETVQRLRDTNYIDSDPSTDWDNGLNDGTYAISRADHSLSLSDSDKKITQNNVDFNREVVIEAENSGQADSRIKATAKIQWQNERGSQKLEMATVLTDSH